MTYLLAYDIETNNIRTKIAKTLIKMGLERIQYSVFVGPLSQTEKQELEQKIQKLLMKEQNYSILFIPLHEDMLSGITEICHKDIDWEYLKGEKNVLIL